MTQRNILEPLEHKVSVIEKEIDAAFASYTRHYTYLTTLRGYSLTLTLAFLGFLITARPDSIWILIPFIFGLTLFVYLEGTEISTLASLKRQIGTIEQIFMETNAERFTKTVEAYVFNGIGAMNLRNIAPMRVRIKSRIRSIGRGTILWHISLLAMTVLTLIGIQLDII